MRNVAYSAFFLIFASNDPTGYGSFILYVSACGFIFSYVVDMNIEEMSTDDIIAKLYNELKI